MPHDHPKHTSRRSHQVAAIGELEQHAIHINELENRLLADKCFTTSAYTYQLVTVELRVKDLELT
ncbi:hypothetical protein HNO89_003614 [Sporosarcina luteola]|nr:hypothetical protein [Sporosarcina luteola]